MDVLVPELLLINIRTPILVEVASKKLINFGRDPGKGVYSIGDMPDGNLVNIEARPEELPHLARNGPMQCAHAVMLACELQGEHGHSIGRAPTMILAGHIHKLIPVQAELSPVRAEIAIHEIVVEGIIASGYWRMRGEKRVRCDHLARLIKAQPTCYQFSTALQAQKGSMTFVDMPGGWRDA